MTTETIAKRQAMMTEMQKVMQTTPIPLESLNISQPNPPVAVMLNMGLDPTKHISEQQPIKK